MSMSINECPEAPFHGKPFRYCVCGWNENTSLEETAAYLLKQTTGLDVQSDHGRGTPRRFVRMLRELTTPEEFTLTTFLNSEDRHDLIVVQDIPFVSLCNHHVIPFVGKAHIAYVPGDNIVGLSKFARLVHYHAKRLHVQENLTADIAEHLWSSLKPIGVGVVMQAEHMCMTIRGVQTPGTLTTTSVMQGCFADHDKTAKSEFMSIIGL